MKKHKKIILSLIFILSLSILTTTNTLNASSLTPNQIQAIISLLKSFGADSNTISKVQASLEGKSPSSTNYNPNYYSNRNNTGATQSLRQCINLTHDFYIGKKDSDTNGEVSKLQRFLIREGVYPEAIVSGYYGRLTAQAVMRWQHAHGMEFTNLRSGVGPKTRAKMRCGVGDSVTLPKLTKVDWVISKANPQITDKNDYRIHEQRIDLQLSFKDGTTRVYHVGNAYGCKDAGILPSYRGDEFQFGLVNCYFALSGESFTAYFKNGSLVVRNQTDDASGITSGKTKEVLNIPIDASYIVPGANKH